MPENHEPAYRTLSDLLEKAVEVTKVPETTNPETQTKTQNTKMNKKLRMPEVLTPENIGKLNELVNPAKSVTREILVHENPKINGFYAKCDYLTNAKEYQKVQKCASKYFHIYSQAMNVYSYGIPPETRGPKFLKNASLHILPGTHNPKELAKMVKTKTSIFDQNRGYFVYNHLSYSETRTFYANLSLLRILPNSVSNAIRQAVENEPYGVSRSTLKKLFPKIIGELLNLEIEPMLDTELSDLYSKFSLPWENLQLKETSNSLVWEYNNSPGFLVARGLVAIDRIINSQVGNVILELRRTAKRQRSARSQYLESLVKTKYSGKTQALTDLMKFHPRTWPENPRIPAILKYLANRDFPLGSLSAVEIEFVADCTSPLVSNSEEYENCGECSGCEAIENGEEDACCEDPVSRPTQDFLVHPMIAWTTDSSVSPTRQNQVRLNYQEVRCVQNVNDPKALETLCNWMNSNKLEVNRTCGLHVHLDTRDLTLRQYTAKAKKAREAVKNWMQFCVPFTRFQGAFCSAFSDNRFDRYKAVNTLSRDKHNTIEFRLGSASTNFDKIWNWVQLCRYIIRGSKRVETINEFLESDANPELKAFVIARICRFYKSHVQARDPKNPENQGFSSMFTNPNHPANKVPDDIHKIVKVWGSVGIDELGG